MGNEMRILPIDKRQYGYYYGYGDVLSLTHSKLIYSRGIIGKEPQVYTGVLTLCRIRWVVIGGILLIVLLLILISYLHLPRVLTCTDTYMRDVVYVTVNDH